MPLHALAPTDEALLRRAIELAREARADGRHPFGSLIVNAAGVVVVESRNNAVLPAGDPTQHAELLACAAVSRLLSDAELGGCALYTSTEPCPMCAGAIYWTGVGRVVFALSQGGLGRFVEGPTLELPCREIFACGSRTVVVDGPFLEDEAGVVHEGFWR